MYHSNDSTNDLQTVHNQPIRLLFTGGGSGGHVHPALAVAEEALRLAPDTIIRYVGTASPETELVPPEFGLVLLPSTGMPSIRSIAFLKFAWTVFKGTFSGVKFVLSYRPQALFATGGYASAPAIFATAVVSKLRLLGRKIPIYLFEPNAEPGRMNLLAAKLADRIAVVNEHARVALKVPEAVVEGYPVRWQLRGSTRRDARKQLGIPDQAKVILAFGGSMGARSLNIALVEAWKELRSSPDLYLIHAVGRRQSAEYHAQNETEQLAKDWGVEYDERYLRVVSFDDMSAPYAAADIVITRPGAGTIAEICEQGLAAILVPKANITGDHHAANAVAMQIEQAAEVIFERSRLCDTTKATEAIDVTELVETVRRLLDNPSERETLRLSALRLSKPGARTVIAENLLHLATGFSLPVTDPSTVAQSMNRTTPLGLTPVALRARLEQQLHFSWNDLLPVRVLDLPEKPLPTTQQRQNIPYFGYYRYRGNALLAASSWETRNEGIKISALCGDREVLPILLAWITDRRPATGWQYRLGGDFQTVGFLRRNAVAALPALNWWNSDVIDAIRIAFDDPYWEVRTIAAKSLIRLPADIPPALWKRMVELLQERIPREKHYEARAANWLALGAISPELPPYDLVKADLIYKNDLVRSALIMALERLVLRGMVLSDEYVATIQQNLLLTSSQFVPNFVLRRAAARFQIAHQESQ